MPTNENIHFSFILITWPYPGNRPWSGLGNLNSSSRTAKSAEYSLRRIDKLLDRWKNRPLSSNPTAATGSVLSKPKVFSTLTTSSYYSSRHIHTFGLVISRCHVIDTFSVAKMVATSRYWNMFLEYVSDFRIAIFSFKSKILR